MIDIQTVSHYRIIKKTCLSYSYRCSSCVRYLTSVTCRRGIIHEISCGCVNTTQGHHMTWQYSIWQYDLTLRQQSVAESELDFSLLFSLTRMSDLHASLNISPKIEAFLV